MPIAQLINDADLVIGVTQRSINDQLRVLYNTRTGADKNGKPTYLLHHEFLQHAEGDEKNLTVQLQVESPTVDLNDSEVPNPVTTDPTVRLSFRVTSGTYKTSRIVGEGDDEHIVHENKDVPSGTLSWLAHLDQRQLFGFNDTNHPEAVKHIKPFVDNKDFLVSSLFVKFEESKMAEKLQYKPDDVEVIDSHTMQNMMQKFFDALVQNFRGAMDKPEDNPYILGYTITQNPNHPPAEKVLLQPKAYRYSLKPHPKDASLNTLNFYLFLTPPTSDDAGKGQLSTSLVISAGGDLVPFTDDGVLAISSLTFHNKIIVDLIVDAVKDRFWLGKEVLQKSTKAARDTDSDLNVNSLVETNESTEFKRHAEYENTSKKRDDTWIAEARFWWKVFQDLDIKYTSVLENARTKSTKLGPNDARTVSIKLDFFLESRTQVETRTHLEIDDWSDMGYVCVKFSYSADITLSTADSGKWVPTIKLNLPKKNDKGQWELDAEDHLSNWFKAAIAFKNGLDWKGFIDDYVKVFEPLGTQEMETFTDSWAKIVSEGLNDISSKVITPAGNVFTSKGLDSDSLGNIYTHLKYDTPRS